MGFTSKTKGYGYFVIHGQPFKTVNLLSAFSISRYFLAVKKIFILKHHPANRHAYKGANHIGEKCASEGMTHVFDID